MSSQSGIRTVACCPVDSKSVKVITVFMIVITILRSVFNIEMLLGVSLCILHGNVIEKCGIPDTMRNITEDQTVKDFATSNISPISGPNTKKENEITGYINLSQEFIDKNFEIGTIFECVQILVHLLVIFRWERFNIWQYIKALPKMAHFSVWVALLIVWMVSSAIVGLARIGSKHNISSLVFAELEAVLTVILASACCFIARQTVYASITDTLGDSPSARHWVRLMRCLYNTSLALFAMRMTTYFVYDTSLIAQSISKLTPRARTDNIVNLSLEPGENVKEWHSIILVFTCAFRGSLARFFYSKLYQGVTLPNVCDNVPVIIGNREIGVRDQEGGRQHVVPWLTQSEEDRLLASSSQCGFDQTHIHSDAIDKESRTREQENVGIVHASQYGAIQEPNVIN